MEIDSGLTLYDMNKQCYSKEKPLDPIGLNQGITKMIEDIINRKKPSHPYWMLLCRERNDYTLFIIFTKEGTINEMIPTLTNRGEILDIEKQEDGNYEIWIRDIITKEVFAYYFFDYSFGIIQA